MQAVRVTCYPLADMHVDKIWGLSKHVSCSDIGRLVPSNDVFMDLTRYAVEAYFDSKGQNSIDSPFDQSQKAIQSLGAGSNRAGKFPSEGVVT